MTTSSLAATPPTGNQLAALSTTSIPFSNNTYQFVELRQFAMPSGASMTDHDVLAALISSPGYRGSFVGTGENDLAIHGPYRVAAISADLFVPVRASDAEAWLRTWAEYAAALPETVRSEVDQAVYGQLRAASSVYQLPRLPDAAKETQWRLAIGNSTGFHEFVAIDRVRCTVTLLVATDD